ncbi:hypothetical protein [Bacillus sp. BML-BC060]|uniref:hypothetical protein n=1 Tax=Bacillus sp. BML-BC060 TaxID=2842487 RepID=UPI001C80EE3E|nr:hypothetical protein [Bacillus sp. BML-BC060]
MRCISCENEIVGRGYSYNGFHVCSPDKCLYQLQIEGIEELIKKKERWLERFQDYINNPKNKNSKPEDYVIRQIAILEEDIEKLKKHPDVRLNYLFK